MRDKFIAKLQKRIDDLKKVEGNSRHDKGLLDIVRESRIRKEINLELIKEMNVEKWK